MDDVESLCNKLIDFYQIKGKFRGREIVRLQETLRISYQILRENYDDLIVANEIYLTDHGIEQPENAQKLERFLFNFQRLLVNYLASFVSFVDHAEVFVKEMNNPRLSKEFDSVMRESKLVEKIEFVRDLRNYLCYYKLPFPRIETDYLPTPEGVLTDTIPGFCKGEVSIRKQELLQWDGFKQISKNFLRGYLGSVIVLVSSAKYGCIDQCQMGTGKVFELLNTKVAELFRTEISDFLEFQNTLKEELRQLKEKWRSRYSDKP